MSVVKASDEMSHDNFELEAIRLTKKGLLVGYRGVITMTDERLCRDTKTRATNE